MTVMIANVNVFVALNEVEVSSDVYTPTFAKEQQKTTCFRRFYWTCPRHEQVVSLFMISFSAYDGKSAINLFRKYNTHKHMRKGHFREA